MIRPYDLNQRYPRNVSNAGQEYRERDGIHVHFDTTYTYDVGRFYTYFVCPVKPFVGLSFAALAHYNKGYKLFKLGFGHELNDMSFVDMYQYDDTFGILVTDKATFDFSRFKKYQRWAEAKQGVHVSVNDYVWFELRIVSPTEIVGYINGDKIVTNTGSYQSLVDTLGPYIKVGDNKTHFCSLLEMHWTTVAIDGTSGPPPPEVHRRLFQAYDLYGNKQPLSELFYKRQCTYVREGGSITLTARNTEPNPWWGMDFGLINRVDEFRNEVYINVKTALSKVRNVILMRKGYQDAVFYCNDETVTLRRRGDQRDYLVIRSNCEPIDIIFHTGRYDSRADFHLEKDLRKQ